MMDSGDEIIGPVNFGNPVESTIRELAETIVEMTGSRSKIAFRPLPADDPLQRCHDLARAREWLGWEPKVTLRHGLERTIAHFDQLLAERGN